MKFNKKMRSMLNASTIGFSFISAIGIGTLMGYYLDKYFETKPYLTLIFMVFGIVAGFKNMFYFVKKSIKEDDSSE
jgi:ATP synthase protein I